MINNDDVSSAIVIDNSFKTKSLLYSFNEFLLLSFDIYQDIKNIAFEKTNINLYGSTKSFYELIQSIVNDTTITFIIYCNALI